MSKSITLIKDGYLGFDKIRAWYFDCPAQGEVVRIAAKIGENTCYREEPIRRGDERGVAIGHCLHDLIMTRAGFEADQELKKWVDDDPHEPDLHTKAHQAPST